MNQLFVKILAGPLARAHTKARGKLDAQIQANRKFGGADNLNNDIHVLKEIKDMCDNSLVDAVYLPQDYFKVLNYWLTHEVNQ